MVLLIMWSVLWKELVNVTNFLAYPPAELIQPTNEIEIDIASLAGLLGKSAY